MVTITDEVEVRAAEVAVMEAKEEAEVMDLNRKKSLRKLTKENAIMANKLTTTLLLESSTRTTKTFTRM